FPRGRLRTPTGRWAQTRGHPCRPPARGDLPGTIGSVGRPDPNRTGQIPLHRCNHPAIPGSRNRQILAEIIGNAAYDPTGIRYDPEFGWNSRPFLGRKQESAAIRKPSKVVDGPPTPAGDRLL